MSVALEPLRLFSGVNPDGGGSGKQAIIDVAVVGVDDSSRRINDNPLQPLITRFAQKTQKFHSVADQHGYQFVPNGLMKL